MFDFDYEMMPDSLMMKVVQYGEVDKHRHYELQELVFKLELYDDVEYVKTKLVTQIYSESGTLGDVNHLYPNFEIVYLKEVITVIYDVI